LIGAERRPIDGADFETFKTGTAQDLRQLPVAASIRPGEREEGQGRGDGGGERKKKERIEKEK